MVGLKRRNQAANTQMKLTVAFGAHRLSTNRWAVHADVAGKRTRETLRTGMAMPMTSLFLSYGHRDMAPINWVERLKLYLAPIRQRVRILFATVSNCGNWSYGSF